MMLKFLWHYKTLPLSEFCIGTIPYYWLLHLRYTILDYLQHLKFAAIFIHKVMCWLILILGLHKISNHMVLSIKNHVKQEFFLLDNSNSTSSVISFWTIRFFEPIRRVETIKVVWRNFKINMEVNFWK